LWRFFLKRIRLPDTYATIDLVDNLFDNLKPAGAKGISSEQLNRFLDLATHLS